MHIVCVGGMSNSTSKSTSASQRSLQQQNYQTPASALYETADEPTASSALAGRSGNGSYLLLFVYSGIYVRVKNSFSVLIQKVH